MVAFHNFRRNTPAMECGNQVIGAQGRVVNLRLHELVVGQLTHYGEFCSSSVQGNEEKRMKKEFTLLMVMAAALTFASEARAGYSAVKFQAPAGHNAQYTRVYVDGQSCYLESAGVCTGNIVLYNGFPGSKGVLYRVRYSKFPNNGGYPGQEIAHQDVWIRIPYLGGNENSPAPYTVTIPISYVTFTASNVGYGQGGYQVYVVSSDNVGQYLDATLPKKNNLTLGFFVGNTAGGPTATVKLLAGCYTVSFASPWNNTGTSGARPITNYWTLENPVCVDGVNDQAVDSSAP